MFLLKHQFLSFQSCRTWYKPWNRNYAQIKLCVNEALWFIYGHRLHLLYHYLLHL